MNQSNRNLTTAVAHGQLVMERIRDTSFSSVAGRINNATWNYNTGDIQANLNSAPLVNETVVAAMPNGIGDPLDVTVTVSWDNQTTSPLMRRRSIVLRTQLTEY